MNAFEPYDERHKDCNRHGRIGVNISTVLSLTMNDMKKARMGFDSLNRGL